MTARQCSCAPSVWTGQCDAPHAFLVAGCVEDWLTWEASRASYGVVAMTDAAARRAARSGAVLVDGQRVQRVSADLLRRALERQGATLLLLPWEEDKGPVLAIKWDRPQGGRALVLVAPIPSWGRCDGPSPGRGRRPVRAPRSTLCRAPRRRLGVRP